MAFQIKDDLFDYGEKNRKPLGIDIKEKNDTPFNSCFKYCFTKKRSIC